MKISDRLEQLKESLEQDGYTRGEWQEELLLKIIEEVKDIENVNLYCDCPGEEY